MYLLKNSDSGTIEMNINDSNKRRLWLSLGLNSGNVPTHGMMIEIMIMGK